LALTQPLTQKTTIFISVLFGLPSGGADQREQREFAQRRHAKFCLAVYFMLCILSSVYSLNVFKYTAPEPPLALTAYRTNKPLDIDGDLSDEQWQAVPFTPNFGDISGPGIIPKNNTKAKILFDDNYIYVGVLIDEPYPVATMREGHIWKDNSIGIYFDAASSCNGYNQYDINAWTAESSIVLIDTYKTGINLIDPYIMHGLQKGVKVQGYLNDPLHQSTSWSLELAFPLKYLTQLHDEGKPKDGSVWRILISRVEWGYKVVNQTWVKDDSINPWYSTSTPQWKVSLHHPENYNFLQFTDQSPKSAKLEYPKAAFEVQQVLLWLANAQSKYNAKEGKYATSYDMLDISQESFKASNGADHLEETFILMGIYPDPYGYACSILHKKRDGSMVVWSVRDDFKMWKTPYYVNPSGSHNIPYGIAVTSILFNVAFGLALGVLGVYVFLNFRKKASYHEIKE
jgi:hypothetical protein